MQNPLLHILAGVGAFAIIGAMFSSRDEAVAPSTTAAPAHGQALAVKSGASRQSGFAGDETVIERDASGQFHLQARVNGEDVEFLVDTGADIVALTPADAERLGIQVAPDDFRPIMQTASGVGNAATVQLDRLELGDDEFHDVGAVVIEGLEVNLLGQSVLRRFGKVEMRGDRMVIEHQ